MALHGSTQGAGLMPRIGDWETGEDGEVELLAVRCASCGESFFPSRSICANCRGTKLDSFRLRGPATLHSYTVVHQVPAGFSGPIAVGYAAFDGGVLLLAPVDPVDGDLHEGARVGLHTGVTRHERDGTEVTTYRFRLLPPEDRS
jgi:uncharacterized OB-fold protein